VVVGGGVKLVLFLGHHALFLTKLCFLLSLTGGVPMYCDPPVMRRTGRVEARWGSCLSGEFTMVGSARIQTGGCRCAVLC
jgi:hypothetical protein